MLRTLKDSPYVGMVDQNTKYIATGIETLDNAFNSLVSGTVTIITGRPASGKSTLVHSIILNAIDKRHKTLLFDGEYERNQLLNTLFRQVIGNDETLYKKIRCNLKVRYEPKPQVQKMLNKWFDDILITFSKHETDLTDLKTIFELTLNTCKALDVDVVVYDNLMSLISSSQAEQNAEQTNFMKMCTSLAKAANVAVILVTHPNGTALKGKELDFYQISGTTNLPNLADNIIHVIKDPTDDNEEVISDGRINVLKNRYYGEYPKIDLAYDKTTMSLCEIYGGGYKVGAYNWRMNGRQQTQWIEKEVKPI